MRSRFAGAFLLAMVLAGAARAETPVPTPADRDAIQTVISSQLDAFRHDDADGAFAFAAPNIQQMFHDPANFMAMVQRGYPAIYRPKDIRFLDSGTSADGQVFQRVQVEGPDGLFYRALYVMEQGSDGVWRIAACMLEQPLPET